MSVKIRKAIQSLKKADPVIASLIDKHGDCTLLSDVNNAGRGYFHVLVWAIINQQLSVMAAKAIEKKLQEKHGGFRLTPARLLRMRKSTLAKCGLSASKVGYIRNLARAVTSGSLSLEALEKLDDKAASEALMAHPGIGPWTADMFLMFALERLDIVPLGDLALRKSMQKNYLLADDEHEEAYFAVAEKWRPYRSVASWYLWAAVD